MPVTAMTTEQNPSRKAAQLLTGALKVLQEEPLNPQLAQAVTRVGRAVQYLWQADGKGAEQATNDAAELIAQARDLVNKAPKPKTDARSQSLTGVTRTFETVLQTLRPTLADSGVQKVAHASTKRISLPPDRRMSSAPPGSERRSSQRIHLVLDVAIGLASDSNFYMGLTEDISEGGLFVATYEFRPIGSKVQVKFLLPGSRTEHTIPGTVRWMRDHEDEETGAMPGMGVQFDNVPEAARRDIENFVNRRAPLFYDED